MIFENSHPGHHQYNQTFFKESYECNYGKVNCKAGSSWCFSATFEYKRIWILTSIWNKQTAAYSGILKFIDLDGLHNLSVYDTRFIFKRVRLSKKIRQNQTKNPLSGIQFLSLVFSFCSTYVRMYHVFWGLYKEKI